MNSPRFVRFSQPHYLQQIGRERVTQILLPVTNELLPHGIAMPATALPDELFFQVLATLPRRAAECSQRLLEAMTAIEVIDDVFPDERTPLVVSELRLRVRVKSRPVLLAPASQHGVLDLEVCGGWESGRIEAVEVAARRALPAGMRSAECGLANAEEGTEVRRSQTAATNEEVARSAKGGMQSAECPKHRPGAIEPAGRRTASGRQPPSAQSGEGILSVAAERVPGNGNVIQRVGRLAYRNGFADVWLGEEHFDLSRRAKARACLQYLVEQRAFDAKAARDLTHEIDLYVRAQCALPALPGYGELKMHHYFNPSTSAVARLGRELIRPAGRNGRYFLNVR